MIIEAIKTPAYSGVFNGTAPKPVTMAQLCSSVGGVLGRPSWLPVPDFAITTLLGEGAQVSCACGDWHNSWLGLRSMSVPGRTMRLCSAPKCITVG
jgi:hypothetical protein